MKPILALLLSGCVHAANVTLTTAVAATTCDWGQTHAANWHRSQEANPLLGNAPSDGTVNAYMISSLALLVASHYLLPMQVQPFIYTFVAVVEVKTVYDNTALVPGICGF